MTQSAEILRFGPFELDPALLELRRDGEPIPMQPKPLRLLLYLVEHRARIVSKSELLESVWPDVAVSDAALWSALRDLRHALGEDGAQPRWIQTRRGGGYRFIGAVELGAPRAATPRPRFPTRAAEPEGSEIEPWDWAARTPFVGRIRELGRLEALWRAAKSGSGGIALLAGDPGIGKTRLLEQLARIVRAEHGCVLGGTCFEGEPAAPYAAIAEALAELDGDPALEPVLDRLGIYASVVRRVLPGWAERAAESPEAPELSPLEEQDRMCHGIARLLEQLARARPLLLVLDDLQWSDSDTLVLLRRIARAASGSPLLIAVAYRAAEVTREHALSPVLAALTRETRCVQLPLSGLHEREARELIDATAARDLPLEQLDQLLRVSEGNPFFIRELVLHLLEEARLPREARPEPEPSLADGAQWLPAAVRQAVELRLARISADARRFLALGACVPGPFAFEVVARAAQLASEAALAVLDEALAAQLIRPAKELDSYDFAHALIREFLYAEQSSSRLLRLHRRLAEVMESEYGPPQAEHASAIAHQYQRSAALPGAERGVPYCILAAERASRAAAHGEVAEHLAGALALLPEDSPERPRLLARLGMALAWSHHVQRALRAASEAAEALAASEGDAAAADYLADAADALWTAAYDLRVAQLAEQGLRYIGVRRDRVWARLVAHQRYAGALEGAPDGMGLCRRFADEREISHILLEDPDGPVAAQGHYLYFESREDVLKRSAHLPVPVYVVFGGGEYRSSLPAFRAQGERALQQGRVLAAAQNLLSAAILESALGELDAADATLVRARELAEGIRNADTARVILSRAAVLVWTRGEPLESLAVEAQRLLAYPAAAMGWAVIPLRASSAALFALLGRREEALQWLGGTHTAIEHGPGWAPHYPFIVHSACEAFWHLGIPADFPLEAQLVEKTLRPDFRYPHTDPRLSLARLCALERRFEEAAEWFEEARRVLDEQGARPLRAITDSDEARMYEQRGARGDRARAQRLREAAAAQFESLGMSGWLRRLAQ